MTQDDVTQESVARDDATGRNGRRGGRAERVADCIADSAGGITFDVAGAAGPAAALVLRRRDGAPADGTDREVRLPLTGGGGPGRALRAVLPSTVHLAEGYWDVRTGADGEHAVRPGVRDVRALVDRVPGQDRVTARIPYPTGDGRLAVRSWVRTPHAEAGAIRCDRGTMTVGGVLYGAEARPGAVAEARLSGGGRVHRVPVTGRGSSFAFTLPYALLADAPVERRLGWDLWLRPAPDADGIRISRILDDIWDKRNILVYPRFVRPSPDAWSATPCYTADNGLRVRLEPAPDRP
ncbi:hypothetical protein [Streptomyces liangshanensis]|uniref:hypothetical protein n=1 Tax=Streptomyces liangshanensis TaxID=2717324 RepID=UPI001FBA4984|nr:hypothetical protein [Streptomyces liangshanensis]